MTSPSDRSRIGDILQQAISDLESAGITDPSIDAELLLGFCLGISRTSLYLGVREYVENDQAESFQTLLNRRITREPVAYILGEREFWSLPFYVSPAVLIPRPETEFLLETTLARRNPAVTRRNCLDLCCGSGIIAIVLARELTTTVVAVDISAAALKVARKNCMRHGVGDQVGLVRANLGSCFSLDQQFSLIVSNPPYIRRDEINSDLEPEVSRYEPHLALDGGDSGLESISAIRDMLPSLLCGKGDAFVEIGDRQAASVRALFLESETDGEYEFIDIIKDYAGRDRVVHLRKK
jgi:release factor glutamine methyltransferase